MIETISDEVIAYCESIHITITPIEKDAIKAITAYIISDLEAAIHRKMPVNANALLRYLVICEYFLLAEIRPGNIGGEKGEKGVSQLRLGDASITYIPTEETAYFSHLQQLRKNLRDKLVSTYREVIW